MGPSASEADGTSPPLTGISGARSMISNTLVFVRMRAAFREEKRLRLCFEDRGEEGVEAI